MFKKPFSCQKKCFAAQTSKVFDAENTKILPKFSCLNPNLISIITQNVFIKLHYLYVISSLSLLSANITKQCVMEINYISVKQSIVIIT